MSVSSENAPSSDKQSAHVYAVSEESDDDENLLSEIEKLKEELKNAQEKLKKFDRREYDHLNISSKRKRGGNDDGPSTSRKKNEGNQSDKVRQKNIKMH